MGHGDHRLTWPIAVFDIIQTVAQGSGRALLNGLDHFLSAGAVRVYPRFLSELEHDA